MSKRAKFHVESEVEEFPKIVSLSGGLPQNFEEMHLHVAQRGSSKRVKTIINSEVNGIAYKASDAGDSKYDGCRYAVGVHDLKTGKISLYAANQIYCLEPQLSGFAAAPARQSNMSYAERKKSLTEEFGSRKKKKAMLVAASNTISVTSIAGAAALESSLTTKPSAENDELIRIAQENLSRNKHRKK